jgi:cytochrome c553
VPTRRGRKHPSMMGVAASLSDQDIADLAAYYSQQK